MTGVKKQGEPLRCYPEAALVGIARASELLTPEQARCNLEEPTSPEQP
jgi:hypothetical protein